MLWEKNKEKKKKNYIFIIFGELVVNSNTKKKVQTRYESYRSHSTDDILYRKDTTMIARGEEKGLIKV